MTIGSEPRADNADASHGCACAGGRGSEAAGRPWSRRRLLAGAAGAAIACGGQFLPAGAAFAQTSLSPEAAVQALLEGNRRFVEQRLNSLNEDLAVLKQHTEAKQEPFAAVLSCADSRVPVELVFDQSIGRLFVTRVAGNVATPELIASLEYGAAVLGTKAIVVLGHANCGAVKATIAGKAVPGQISGLYSFIRPAVDRAGTDLEAAIKANASIQAALLRTASPVLAELAKANRLKIVAAYYDLGSGKVTLLG